MAKFEVGQQVAVDSGWEISTRYRLGTVERITPSGQAIVRVGTRSIRFNAQGREIDAAGSRREQLIEATPDILATIRKGKLVSCLKYTRWEDLSLDVLERVAAALGKE